jgi:hypothetical protein
MVLLQPMSRNVVTKMRWILFTWAPFGVSKALYDTCMHKKVLKSEPMTD